VPPTITHATNHIRNGLSGGFFSGLLVLIGLWDRYEQETAALGFDGVYERYLASQAGFPDDPKAYRVADEAKRVPQVSAALEE
jgi:hypothetical protein